MRSEDVIEEMRELLELARVSILEKNYNRALESLKKIEAKTWEGKREIREQWKNDNH